jgi:hypothetical protein
MNINSLETRGVGKKSLCCWVLSCGFQFAGMWYCVVGQVLADIPKVYSAFKFRAKPSKKTTCTTWLCMWRHHNPLKLCDHSPRSTVSHPRIPDSTAASFWRPWISHFPVTEPRYKLGDFLHLFLIFPCLFFSTLYYRIVEIWPYFVRVVISYFPCVVIHMHTLQE